WAAEARSDLGGLVHYGKDEVTSTGVRGDLAHGRPGQDADRVEGDVAHQLEPDVGAYVLLDWALQPSSDHRLAECGAAFRDRSMRFSDRETRTFDVPDHPWRLDLGRAIDNAADRMLRRYYGRYRAARIHRLDPAPLVWARHPVEVPPGDAVLRRHDAGVRSEERRNERSGVGVA